MNPSATPTRRGDFLYHGVLLFDPGNSTYYKRESISRLDELLMPNASVRKPRDETASFYEAQLVHYGLQRTKEKSRAKLRLLEALLAGQLQVPADVKQTEATLKREYQAGIRASKTPQRSPQAIVANQSKKKDVERAPPPPPPKTPASTSKPVAVKAEAAVPVWEEFKTLSLQGPRQNQTARYSGSPRAVERSFDQPTSSTKRNDRTKSSEELMVSGTWDLSCPVMEADFAEDCSMELVWMSNTPIGEEFAWGSYYFGGFEGVLKASPEGYGHDGSLIMGLEWRGRENGMGEMLFGPNNAGEITVFSDGSLEGYFTGMYGGDVDFTGQLDGECDRTPRSFQIEWDEYNEDNYEYERVNRWQ